MARSFSLNGVSDAQSRIENLIACVGWTSTILNSMNPRHGSYVRQPVALAPRPFAVLLRASAQAQKLVTKNALLDAVWGHRFVTESVLKTAISEVRAALDDDPKQPRFIETVSRRGYRFIAAPVAARLQSAAAVERNDEGGPFRSDSAHGIVPRRCRAGRPHPRGRGHARETCPQPVLAQGAS